MRMAVQCISYVSLSFDFSISKRSENTIVFVWKFFNTKWFVIHHQVMNEVNQLWSIFQTILATK